jgi:tRNA G18 (ribose-2'-O)-methylase SpoU
MVKIPVNDLEHPSLEPFRELRFRNPTRHAGYFIAEGRLVVERLLNSQVRIKSVIVEAGRESLIEAKVPDEVELLLLSPKLIDSLVGFNFHRGVMACGIRPEFQSIQQVPSMMANHSVMVATYEVQDPTNLGTMIRTASAFGSPGMLLGRATADPYARRVLRVSMGNALHMRFVDSLNLADDLQWLQREHGIASVAATLAPDAVPLEQFSAPGPLLAVFGNEATGLPKAIESACTYRVTVSMQQGTDSLNVAVATGIFLYELTRQVRAQGS